MFFFNKILQKPDGPFSIYIAFQPYVSERSWQSSPSNRLSIFNLSDIQTVPPIAS